MGLPTRVGSKRAAWSFRSIVRKASMGLPTRVGSKLPMLTATSSSKACFNGAANQSRQ